MNSLKLPKIEDSSSATTERQNSSFTPQATEISLFQNDRINSAQPISRNSRLPSSRNLTNQNSTHHSTSLKKLIEMEYQAKTFHAGEEKFPSSPGSGNLKKLVE